MATAIDVKGRAALQPPRVRGSGLGFVVVADRSRAFQVARRHSLVVKTLKVLLPAASVCILAGYVAAVMNQSGGGLGASLPSLPQVIPDNLTLENPRYEGYTKDGGSFVVTAKSAVQDLKPSAPIRLNEITGQLLAADKTRTDLTAATGTFDTKTNDLELAGGIDIASQGGFRSRLQSASIKTKEGLISSNDPVEVEMPAGRVTSARMTLRQKAREVTFQGDVSASFKPPATPQSSPAAQPATASRLALASSQPIAVTANRLDVDDTRHVAIFSGGVVARQGEASLGSPEIEVRYEGREAGAENKSAAPIAAQMGAEGGKITSLVAKGPVQMVQPSGERVTSESARFDPVNQSATLAGKVVMSAGSDRRATAEKAEVTGGGDSIVLTGNVHVLQGRNELRGRRLLLDRKAGRTEVSSPAEGNSPASRIFARFYQTEGKGKAAAPKAGQAGTGGFAAFKTDPTAPVDIEADTLVVADTAKTAQFRGDVRVAQGDFQIRTIELIAHYTGQAGLADQGKEAGAKPAAQLSRIEARRKVLVTSRDGQSATGDWADFDAKANAVTLGGDVVLSEGQNVVRGSRLHIDLNTGESRIDTAPAAGGKAAKPVEASQPAGKPADGAGAAAAAAKSGRPSAVFYPQQLKDRIKAREGDAGKGSTAPTRKSDPRASSWDATTSPRKAPEAAPAPGN